MLIVDVWGGVGSMDHVARFVLPVDEGMVIAQKEVSGGFLVNLRHDAEFGPDQTFDTRVGGMA
jgi:hypothetical protein